MGVPLIGIPIFFDKKSHFSVAKSALLCYYSRKAKKEWNYKSL